MKLIYISNTPIPSRLASSVHIMKMCQAFAKNGHQVVLLVPDRPAAQEPDTDVYGFYGVDECFQIEKLSSKKGSIIYGLSTALRARGFEPDLVYGRFVIGCFFSHLLGFPTVFELHAPIRNFSRFGKWLFSRVILRRFKRLVVISNALRQYSVSEYAVPAELIRVVHDAADEPHPSLTVSFSDPDRLQVGYIGHLYPGKGMEIIEPLVRQCPWANFHLIGGQESDIIHWKQRLAGLNNVTFYGFLPYSQTEQFRGSFDVLLAPYQKKVLVLGQTQGDIGQWTSPLKIFEYMSVAKPMLVSDIPVLREVIRHKVNALLCDPENINSWIEALERLRDDSALAHRLGAAAYREFRAKYTWPKRAEAVIKDIGV